MDVDDWSPTNPARGQCGSTALVLHDHLGGDLLRSEVLLGDGSRQGLHWANQLPNGTRVDLTAVQFAAHEHLQPPVVVPRPSGATTRLRSEHALLSRLVAAHLAAQRHRP